MDVTACIHELPIFTLASRNKIVEDAVRFLKTWSDDFDAIAVSGYSSAMVAPIVCHELQKNLVLVRKTCETRHSSYLIEGGHGQRVIFFDDLIASGKTFEHIKQALPKIACHLTGYYLYYGTDPWYFRDHRIDLPNMHIEKWAYNPPKYDDMD